MRSRSPLPLVAALVLSAAPASAQWKVGVGGTPARDGRATAIGPTAPDLAWQGSLPGIVAQQAVVDQGIAVVNRIQSFAIPTGTWIVAHDLADGRILWQVQLPASFPDSWRSRVTGFRDGRVYATRSGNTNAEFLYALDPADGSILWTSRDLVTETTTESVAFASDGDPITNGIDGNGASVIHRIEATDGTTVWSLPRLCPTSGGCDVAVFGDRGYYWEPTVDGGQRITVADLATGTALYSSPTLALGFIQQLAPFAGPDGTVYAPRSQNNPSTDYLVALEDTGAALVESWRVPIGFVPFATHAVGPDGSVYAYSRDQTLLRLDPSDGSTIDESPVLPLGGAGVSGRMAVDPSGKLFFTNGEFALGELTCFTPDLQVLWSEPIPNVNVGGPAVGADGTVVVCGTGTDVRAYRGDCDGYALAYGTGCAGSGGFVPSLDATGCPTGGQTVTLHVAQGSGGAPAVLVLGTGDGTVALDPFCDLLVDPIVPSFVFFALQGAGAGAGTADLPVALQPGTPPGDAFLQAFVVDLGAPSFLAATNGLRLRIE